MSTETSAQTLTFLRRGQPVTLNNVAPDRTLLEVLREDLHCTGTKEGCGEGDCGACTVVLGEAVDGKLEYKAINSCIRLAHSVEGLAVWTVEDISADAPAGELHPAQEAMVQCHGSQCGFCTPGFVMSLFGMYQNTDGGKGIDRAQAQADLSGNLCRCTGYRPILDAAQQMVDLPLPAGCGVNEAQTVAALQVLNKKKADGAVYLRPTTLAELLQQRAAHPKAQVVAGCTDVGLWVTKMHKRFATVLDVTTARELRRVERYPNHIAIGAAVNLTEAYDALVQDRPQLKTFAQRFAGLPVRNSGTLGGNVANGSPIGDSMPLLIALGASVVLMRWDARKGQIAHRELPLEDLYTGYRTNVMKADELLCWVKVPLPQTSSEFMRVYKISKRFDDDISAVCLAIQMTLKEGVVQHISIGAGGVAATPVRARRTEAALWGQTWTTDTVKKATEALRAEFQPISDMRASAHYRHTVLGNLLQRFWLESQGLQHINLDNLNAATLEALA
ncbi:xanthine dehydrogenase small subunit [Hydrogenophaga sp. 2FB]|uniref:xanthine dehydrogenase small subunit n=1 Tax=Hydrogenophaga sp. 2FB TaxID=2502187 RepID=UPI0010F4B1DC|nr:xanthine dehydrogenase small subunit [Hydrogenophaga sp. 2FB]